MVRKNYNKKYYSKKYYNKKNNNSDIIEGISWLFGWIFILIFFLYYTNKKLLDNIILFLEIFIPIFLISWGLIFYYLKDKRKKIEEKRKENIPDFLLKLENNIRWFKPLKKYDKEESYHTWLYAYLQHFYPNLEIEKSIEYSRPDIVIDNIAIEIKWPTNMSALKTLPDKINQYLNKWDYLFIVLYDINIVNTKTKEENIRIYVDKKKEIIENIIESKRKKVFFVEIS